MNIILITMICKLLDNALSTLKNIYLQKGKYFLSSGFSAIGTFFYMVAIVNTIRDNSFGNIIALCIATFLGSYLPGKFIEKIEKDELYVYDITTPSFEEGVKFADSIRDLNIPIKTAAIYNEELEKVIGCKIFCATKEESIMVKDLIGEGYKYHAYVAKNF